MTQEVAVRTYSVPLSSNVLIHLAESVAMHYIAALMGMQALKTLASKCVCTGMAQMSADALRDLLREPLRDPRFRAEFTQYFSEYPSSDIVDIAWPWMQKTLVWES